MCCARWSPGHPVQSYGAGSAAAEAPAQGDRAPFRERERASDHRTRVAGRMLGDATDRLWRAWRFRTDRRNAGCGAPRADHP